MNQVSTSIFNILNKKIPQYSKVVEIGSASAHLSIELARRRKDLNITLNEVRKLVLYRSLFRAWSKQVFPSIISKNIVGIETRKLFNFAWNSGLLQCIPTDQQLKFIENILKFSDEVLFIYPDIRLKKLNGYYNPTNQMVGVEGCYEYEIDDSLFYGFDVLDHGVVSEAEEILGYPFHFILLRHK